MSEEQEKTIYDLELHEILITNYLQIVRVSGGWLYQVYSDYLEHYSKPTFVPFDNEFQQKLKD